MKIEKKIYLPKDDHLQMGIVTYDQQEFMEVINQISISLGAEYSQSENKILPVFSGIRTYEYTTVEGKQEYLQFYREDKMIHYLTHLRLQTYFTDHFVSSGEKITENLKFIDPFCFQLLYKYLESKNYLTLKYYLNYLRDYLQVFKIKNTDEFVSVEQFIQKYQTSQRPEIVGHIAYEYQKQIALHNQKIIQYRN